jgi:hypothetical protein
MAESLWDPQELLGIGHYGEKETIQCVGTAIFQTRCKWTIKTWESLKAREHLLAIGRIAPGEVSKDKLFVLAGLCLCAKYHSRQQFEVAGRWQKIVQQAAVHHNRARSGACFEIQLVKGELEGIRKVSQTTTEGLRNELVAAQRAVSSSNEKCTILQNELVAAQRAVSSSNEKCTILQNELVRASSYQTQLQGAQERLASVQASSSANIERLQLHARLAEEKHQALATSLGSVSLDLEHTRAELQHRAKAVVDRNAQIAKLSSLVIELQESLGQCWLHRRCLLFNAWWVRLCGRVGSGWAYLSNTGFGRGWRWGA